MQKEGGLALEKTKKINIKAIYIVISVIVCSVLMSLVDGILQPDYFFKSIIKVCLFLLVPMGYFLINRSELPDFQSLFRSEKRGVIIALGLGVLVYGFIVGGYFVLRGFIDFSSIALGLDERTGINADNLLYVALYMSFVNSFLEEFLFRGFAFISLKKQTSRGFAYIFSALMFAIYHSGVTAGWFNIGIFLLTLLGLVIAGFVFSFLDEESGNIYTSWIVHMFANFGTNTAGFIILGVI